MGGAPRKEHAQVHVAGKAWLCGYSYLEPQSEQSQSAALEVRTQGIFVGSTRAWLRRKLLHHGRRHPLILLLLTTVVGKYQNRTVHLCGW